MPSWYICPLILATLAGLAAILWGVIRYHKQKRGLMTVLLLLGGAAVFLAAGAVALSLGAILARPEAAMPLT